MRIVVCVKHVPDLSADRRFTAEGRVDREVESTMSELDEHAVEAALQLTEAHGGEVIVLTVGPDRAVAAVRRALQLGAQHAVHVVDDAIAGSDVFGTSTVLAGAVRRIEAEAPVDLVLTGMAALDGLTAVVPTLLAAMLGRPQATMAAELVVTGETVRVRRELDVVEVLEVGLPAVVSVTDQANVPRQPSFPDIIAARSAPVTRWSLADLGVEPGRVGAGAARTRVLDARPRPPRTDQVTITGDDAGVRLVRELVDRGVL